MRVQRSLLTAAVIGVLVTSIGACSSSKTPSNPDNGSTAAAGDSSAKASKNYKIGVLLSTQIGFHQAMACGATTAAKDLGVTLNIQAPPTTDVAAQVSELQSVLATKPDAIVITASNKDALVAPLKQATAQGVKVVFVDAAVTNWQDVGLAFISTDNVSAGAQAAQSLVKSLNGKSGSVAVFSAAPGIQTLEDRGDGFSTEIKKHPEITLLPVQYAKDAATAQSSFLSLYAAHSDLVGVLGTSESVATGLGGGLTQAKAQDKVAVYGFDASVAEMQLIATGALTATVEQRPYQEGQLGIQTAVAALAGKAFDKQQSVPTTVVTKANYQDADVQQYVYKGSCI